MEIEGTDGTDDFRLGVAIRLFNYNLDRELKRECRVRQVTLAKLSELMGYPYWKMAKFKAFKEYPSEEDKIKIAIFLKVPIDTIFPEEIKGVRVAKQPEPIGLTVQDAIEAGLVRGALETDPNAAAEIAGLRAALESGMEGLTGRERGVLEMRFGWHDGKSRTLESVGREFGVSREQIRRIENKALRRMRHPSRTRKFRTYVGPPEESRDPTPMEQEELIKIADTYVSSRGTPQYDLWLDTIAGREQLRKFLGWAKRGNDGRNFFIRRIRTYAVRQMPIFEDFEAWQDWVLSMYRQYTEIVFWSTSEMSKSVFSFFHRTGIP